MPKKEEQANQRLRRREDEPAEKLDALNATISTRKNAAQAIRRRMEAQIERKAKAKRTRETPASAGFKRV